MAGKQSHLTWPNAKMSVYHTSKSNLQLFPGPCINNYNFNVSYDSIWSKSVHKGIVELERKYCILLHFVALEIHNFLMRGCEKRSKLFTKYKEFP